MQGNDTRDGQSKEASSWFTYLYAWTGGLLTGLIRLVPHPANFAAVGGLGIFAGSRIRSWWALTVPVGVMLVTDFGLYLATGFDPKYSPLHISRAFVYFSILLYVVIGWWLCRQVTVGRVVAASLLGSLQFFVITNFCEWLFQPLMPGIPEAFLYSRDFGGLVSCFAAALPFLANDFPQLMHEFITGHPGYSMIGTALGDLFFAGVFFGLYGALASAPRQTSPQREPVQVGAE